MAAQPDSWRRRCGLDRRVPGSQSGRELAQAPGEAGQADIAVVRFQRCVPAGICALMDMLRRRRGGLAGGAAGFGPLACLGARARSAGEDIGGVMSSDSLTNSTPSAMSTRSKPEERAKSALPAAASAAVCRSFSFRYARSGLRRIRSARELRRAGLRGSSPRNCDARSRPPRRHRATGFLPWPSDSFPKERPFRADAARTHPCRACGCRFCLRGLLPGASRQMLTTAIFRLRSGRRPPVRTR